MMNDILIKHAFDLLHRIYFELDKSDDNQDDLCYDIQDFMKGCFGSEWKDEYHEHFNIDK
jgi:hypothetical protein